MQLVKNPNVGDFMVEAYDIQLNIARVTETGIDTENAKWTGGDGQTGPIGGYIDMTEVTVPVGRVVTGAGLNLTGNRIGLQLQHTSFTPNKKELGGRLGYDPLWTGTNQSSAHWFASKYVDHADDTPKPNSLLIGAAQYKKGNRVAIKVLPGFYELEGEDQV